ncbi:MAG: hypothetical protein KUG62_03765 [Rhodobacteraceae bacterium]|nr:hypothetical protein [Paracoccaceae bacterium]
MTAFARRSRIAGYLNRFAKDDGGAILAFSIYAILIIIMAAGIGIDMMMFERDRIRLQSTSDRASLAAADLDQTLDPTAVVEDYFDKEGLSDYLISVVVDEGMNYREVSVLASTEVQTNFMRMTGIETLTASATSTAEERIDGIEISMVLDVSGSMSRNNRLVNLKVAARDFIDTMYENSEEGKTSISIVPYATQVSAPQYLFDELNVSNEHNYSRCITFEADDFETASIDIESELKRSMHFDPWSGLGTDGRSTDPMTLVQAPVCESDAAREMMVLQDDTNALKSFISGFEAGGNTSIDVGMKWGSALLDPSMKPVIENLVGSNIVSENFIERPETYTSGESLKIIVLMTDGQNTSQYYIEDEFREGNSNIWWNDDHEEVEKYSVYIGLDEDDLDNDGIVDEGLFFWPHDETWNDHAYGNGTYEETVYDRVCKSYRRNGSCKRYKTVATGTVVVDEPGQAEIVTYADLWAYTHLYWNSNYNYGPWMGYQEAFDDWYWGVFDWVDSSSKNARTKSICDAAKGESILIYTIAFEAPEAGEVVLQDCASSDGHFFSVDGLEIADAFNSIASSIRKLRLTQ